MFYWGLGPQQPLPATTSTPSPSTTTTATTTTTSAPSKSGENNIFLEKLFQSRNEKQESYKSSDCSLTERDENDLVFGIMTTVGYWFITMVLLIGLVLGDRPKITVIGHFV